MERVVKTHIKRNLCIFAKIDKRMKGEKIIILIIILVLIITVIYVLCNIKVCPEVDRPTVPFSTIKDKFKTGDVLCTIGCNLLKGTVMRNYLGCNATHVAMIVRKPSKGHGTPDQLYILELGPYGSFPFRKSDVRFRPLDQVLKESCNSVFGWYPIKKEIELTKEDIKHYRKYRFNYFVPTMFSTYKKYKICSSFVAKIHEDKGLGKNSHIISPCDFYDSERTILFTR